MSVHALRDGNARNGTQTCGYVHSGPVLLSHDGLNESLFFIFVGTGESLTSSASKHCGAVPSLKMEVFCNCRLQSAQRHSSSIFLPSETGSRNQNLEMTAL